MPQVGHVSGSSCPAIRFLGSGLGLGFSPDKAPPPAAQDVAPSSPASPRAARQVGRVLTRPLQSGSAPRTEEPLVPTPE